MIFKKYKRIMHITLVLFILSIMVMPASAAYNPLDNKGFETTITSSTGPNGNWRSYSCYYDVTTTIHRSGSRGAHLSSCFIAQQVNLAAITQFAGIEVYARRVFSYLPGGFEIDVEVLTSSGLTTYTSPILGTSQDDGTSWKRFTWYPPILFGDIIVAIHFNCLGFNHRVVLDDVSILTGRYFIPS